MVDKNNNDDEAFKTAEDMINFFQNKDSFRTTKIWDANTIGRGRHIYRGQADAEWDLKPSVFRSHDALVNFTQQTPGAYTPKYKNAWLGSHLHAELRSVFIFLEVADKIGVETPIDYTMLKTHRELISEAINNMDCDYSEIFPNEKILEWLAFAQHHGVPTRILDWTESPLIACFFAAIEASSVAKGKPVKSKNIAVTCFDTNYFDKSDEIIKVNAPRHRNNFLRLQQGAFTNMPKANKYFEDNKAWPSVENIVENTPELKGALKKYYLPTTEADKMLKILFNYGITTHHLMPSLDNIARSYSYSAHLFKEE